MILSKKPYLPHAKRFWLGFVSVSILIVALLVVRSGSSAQAAALTFYAIMASIFLLAQIVGFIWSQTQYSDAIEEPKLRMLENEEREWND